MKPITPIEAEKQKQTAIPDFVIEIFNKEIVKHLSDGRAVVNQDEVVDLIQAHPQGQDVSRDEIFANHWLDVERIFEKAGWKVNYDKPAYCESYPATFEFSRKRTR